jgi:hypothetical protein
MKAKENTALGRSLFLTSRVRFLDAFAELRKATVSVVVSVCLDVRTSVRPSVRMEQLGTHWTDFHEI